MFQALKSKSKRIASTLAAGVLLFSQLAGVPLVGATTQDNPNDWPYWCTVVNDFDGGVKFEGEGTKPNDNVVNDTIDGITATYSPSGDNTVEKKTVTVTSDATKDVTLVVVKGGNDENGGNEVYDEAPFTDLTAPVNPNNNKTFGISHVIVCYDEEEEEDGTLVVDKVVKNDNGGSKTYADFTFTVDGQEYNFEETTSPDGSKTVTLPVGTQYTVVEPQANSDGYATTYSDGCTGTIAEGTQTCTITNDDQSGTLIVKKVVKNDNGGTKEADDFSFSVDGGSATDFEEDGTNELTVNAGTYDVAETPATGYTTSYENCENVVVPNGGSATCTITNDDNAPSLTLIKQVINQNGGEAEADDWLLKAEGPTTIFGWGGTQSDSTFSAGTYLLSELYGPSGYSTNGWTCVGGDQNGSQISLLPGQIASCTIVNYDNPAEIKVVKEVVNNNGGEAEVEDFKLWVDSTQVLSGVTNDFAGDEWYTISETQVDGYKKTFLKCWDMTGRYPVEVGNPFYAKLGHSYKCKIVNDDIAPKLTIVKDSEPNSIQVFDFDLYEKKYGNWDHKKSFQLNDNNTSFPVDNDKTFYLDAGWFKVTEAATDGWYLDEIKCWGTHEFVDLDEAKVVVNLKLGDEVTCKFTNKKFGAVYGFKFDDVNGDGYFDKLNEAKLADWTITIDQVHGDFEDSTVTGPDGHYSFTDLKPGLYKVCEELQDGWVQTAPGTPSGCKFVWVFPGDSDDVNFGNFKLGQVTGVKFNDLNGNGVRDNGEPTLKDWTITLTKKCEPNVPDIRVDALVLNENQNEEEECEDVTESTKTDANGAYSFGDLEAGTYVVCEVQQTNWTQTAPKTEDGCVEFTVETSGHEEVVDFGNKAKPQVLSEQTLVVTGATNGTKGMLVGLTILSILGALHILARRKSYSN